MIAEAFGACAHMHVGTWTAYPCRIATDIVYILQCDRRLPSRAATRTWISHDRRKS